MESMFGMLRFRKRGPLSIFGVFNRTGRLKPPLHSADKSAATSHKKAPTAKTVGARYE
jgi:hypothetical protein